MNISELKNKLDEAGISPNDYSLDGTLKPVCMILLFSSNMWSVFHYDERGRILALEKFDTESEACENMLKRLLEDKELRIKFKLK